MWDEVLITLCEIGIRPNTAMNTLILLYNNHSQKQCRATIIIKWTLLVKWL